MGERYKDILLLHFNLGLLQLIDLLAYHLHLLELTGHCVYPLEKKMFQRGS